MYIYNVYMEVLMKNSKQHLTDAFSQLQDAQINLKHALDSAEKLNNKIAFHTYIAWQLYYYLQKSTESRKGFYYG